MSNWCTITDPCPLCADVAQDDPDTYEIHRRCMHPEGDTRMGVNGFELDQKADRLGLSHALDRLGTGKVAKFRRYAVPADGHLAILAGEEPAADSEFTETELPSGFVSVHEYGSISQRTADAAIRQLLERPRPYLLEAFSSYAVKPSTRMQRLRWRMQDYRDRLLGALAVLRGEASADYDC